MRARDKKLLEFMGSGNDLIIPVYQRNYDWNQEHCERLFDDIQDIYEKEIREYFMGAFVTVCERANELLVIDGQQRLTTLSLFLLAIHNLLKDKEIQAKNVNLQKIVIEKYLIDVYSMNKDKKKRIKLKQVNQDLEAYNGLFDDDYQDDWKQSNIYKNYMYLKKRIKGFCKNTKEKKDPQNLYDALNKVKIVDIELERNDGNKPQLVFETINATGKRLEDSDLIRNYILMDKNRVEQEELFKNYWEPIEQNTRFYKNNKTEGETSHFIWYFLIFEKGQPLKRKNVYKDFKKHISFKGFESYEKMKEFLEKMKKFSGYYESIAFGGNSPFEYYFEMLRGNLKQTAFYPYLLSLMDYWEKDKQGREKDVKTILQFIINYYVRRSICKKHPNEYNRFFPIISTRIEENMKTGDTYLEGFYRVFANTNFAKIPDDKNLKEALLEPEYNFFGSKICHYIFEKLVNHNTKEEMKIKKSDITIEHIMPQTLTKSWKEMLESNAEEVHKKYLHSLGNLTLTGYNPKLSNKPFEEKKRIFAESNISLNRYFEEKEVETWNENAIIKRAEHLAKKICKILEYEDLKPYYIKKSLLLPTDNYSTLEDCILILKEQKGMKPIDYKIEDKEDKISNWKALIIEIARYLYRKNKEKFKEMAGNPDITFISEEESEYKRYEEIYEDNIYLCTNNSAKDTMQHIKKMLTEYSLADDFLLRMVYGENQI